MDLEPESMKPVINRLKRAQGQIAGVIRLLEEGADCRSAVTQLAAASKAVDRAGFAIIATGLEECMAHGNEPEVRKDLEKLFMSLS